MDGINFNLYINDLFRIFDKLRHVHDKYAPYFRSKTHSAATKSFRTATTSRFRMRVPKSPWDERLIIDQIRKRCDRIN